MFGRPHGRVPEAGTIAAPAIGTTEGGIPAWGIPPAGGTPAAAGTITARGTPTAIVPAGGGGVPPVPVFHADYGPHINPLYVTRNEFNAFRALVNQRLQQLQNQQNQMNQNIQNQQNQINQGIQNLQNQMNQNIQNLQNQMGQNIAGILATFGNINNNLAQINQLLGIQWYY